MAKSRESDAPLPKDPTAPKVPVAAKPKAPKLEGVPIAPPDPTATVVKVVKRPPWEVVMVVGEDRYGPFSPEGGACDASEAIQRVLDATPVLKTHLTKCRWATKQLSQVVTNERSANS